MSDIDQQFTQLSEYATNNLALYNTTFNHNILLRTYANYMQAINGDNTTSSDNIKNNTRDLYKWEAWKAIAGKSVADAKRDYIVDIKRMNKEL